MTEIKETTMAAELQEVVDALIAAEPDKAEQARQRPELIGWFAGRTMLNTGGAHQYGTAYNTCSIALQEPSMADTETMTAEDWAMAITGHRDVGGPCAPVSPMALTRAIAQALRSAEAAARASGRAEGLEEAAAGCRVVSARLCGWREGFGGVALELADGRCVAIALGEPHGEPAPSVEFHQQDWMPGFAAFHPGATTPAPNSRAFCTLNLGAMLAAVDAGDVPAAGMPYLVAESMMHEIIHVLEQWAGVEFSEERIEGLLERYRALRSDPAEETRT